MATTSHRATLETHLISPIAFDILLRDQFTLDDFEAFLAERQRTIQDAIEDLLVKERLDLPPQLRELDDSDHYDSLAGQLEYFDLRELQDTTINKALWPAFEKRFGTREILAERFDQFASLRNCIRHSRAVDEVTRKLGEAATLWFCQVLDK